MYGRLEDQVAEPPPPFKPVPPEDVGSAVVRAIREDRAEIIVGHRALRPLASVYHAAPKLFTRLAGDRRQQEFADSFVAARKRAGS